MQCRTEPYASGSLALLLICSDGPLCFPPAIMGWDLLFSDNGSVSTYALIKTGCHITGRCNSNGWILSYHKAQLLSPGIVLYLRQTFPSGGQQSPFWAATLFQACGAGFFKCNTGLFGFCDNFHVHICTVVKGFQLFKGRDS